MVVSRSARLARIIHHYRDASQGIRHHSAFASLTNTTRIRSVAEAAVTTTTFTSLRFVVKRIPLSLRALASTSPCSATTVDAIRSLSGELFRFESRKGSPSMLLLDRILTMRNITAIAVLLSSFIASTGAAQAAAPDLSTSPLSTLVVLGSLAIVPLLFLATTSFVKLSFVFSILRNALGAAQVPSAMVITVLAIILTCYVMAPVADEMYKASAQSLAEVDLGRPTIKRSVDAIIKSITSAKEPLREFMKRNAAQQELKLFVNLAHRSRAKDRSDQVTADDFLVVLSAFFFTELKEAFQIGFLVFIPFLIIDLVIANILLALGMHMLSPIAVSMPFKLLLFVLVDGFTLLTQALVLGYQ